MALPEKNYYSLQDISSRWAVSLQDARYYAEHGLLEIQVWLPDTVVKLYRNKRTEDGDIASVPVGVSSYKGYAIVEPDELRKIFRNSPRPVSGFKRPDSGDPFQIFDTRARFMVDVADLVVGKEERERFEKEYAVEAVVAGQEASAVGVFPSFPGRPSVMHKVEREFEKRCAEGKTMRSLRQEAMALAAWAEKNVGDAQAPTYKTIMNVLRPKYQAHIHRQSAPQTAPAPAPIA